MEYNFATEADEEQEKKKKNKAWTKYKLIISGYFCKVGSERKSSI